MGNQLSQAEEEISAMNQFYTIQNEQPVRERREGRSANEPRQQVRIAPNGSVTLIHATSSSVDSIPGGLPNAQRSHWTRTTPLPPIPNSRNYTSTTASSNVSLNPRGDSTDVQQTNGTVVGQIPSPIDVHAEVRSNQNLSLFPMDLIKMPTVEWIDLSSNQLRTLPEEISVFKKLRRLACGTNQLESLPDSIGDLKSLQWADFTHNRLTTLPERFGELKHLTGLGLSDCRLVEFPKSVCRLKKLLKLGIFSNRLTKLPSEIAALEKLVKLDVSSNRLESLPDEIGQLVHLSWLNVSHNSLKELPSSMGKLTKLTDLGIGHNQLECLPDLSPLQMLTMLPAYNNRLREIPNWIGKLVALEKLDFSINCIKHLPPIVFTLPSLTYLNVRRNQITHLHIPTLPQLELPEESPSRLHCFDCSDNALTHLPYALLTFCVRLVELRIHHNPWKIPKDSQTFALYPPRSVPSLRLLAVSTLQQESILASDTPEVHLQSYFQDRDGPILTKRTRQYCSQWRHCDVCGYPYAHESFRVVDWCAIVPTQDALPVVRECCNRQCYLERPDLKPMA